MGRRSCCRRPYSARSRPALCGYGCRATGPASPRRSRRRIGGGSGTSHSVAEPAEPPKPAEAQLTGVVLAHVSDLHLGAHSAAAAGGLVADVVAAGPTVTVVTGDLTMRARPEQFRQA